jgi:hypothetical protein
LISIADVGFGILFLGSSAAIAVAALFISRFTRTPALLARLAPAPRGDEHMVLTLCSLADIAGEQGLLILESHPTLSSVPVLQKGISLTLQGDSAAELREKLQHTGRRVRISGFLGKLLPFARPLLASISLALIVMHLALGLPAAVPAASLALTLPALLMTGAASSRGRGLSRQMQIEAAIVIAAGGNGDDLRARLSDLLAPAGQPLRRAA